MDQESRKSLDHLYGVSGSVAPLNFRDASGPWKHEPTKIEPGKSSNKLPRGAGMNPFTRANMGNGNTNTNRSGAGNLTAARTLLNRRESVHRGLADSNRIVKPPEIIHVQDDIEVIPSDELNIVDSPYIPPKESRYFSGSGTLSHPSNAFDHLRKPTDGAATRELERRIGAHQSDGVESIDDFSDNSPKVKNLKGNVKAQVAKIETLRLDLRSVQKPALGIKGKMKSKTGALQDHMATNSAFSNNKLNKPRVKKGVSMIPIKEWYLGVEHKQSTTGYYVQWEKNGKSMTLREEKYNGDSPLVFDVPSEISSLSYVEQTSEGHLANPTIAMGTYSPANKNIKRNTDYFKMGDSRAKGKITLKFDRGHRNWSDGEYSAFLGWLKSHVTDYTTIRGSTGANSLWETAERCGHFQSAETKRKRQGSAEESRHNVRPHKRHASDDVDTLDGSTPPPVGQINDNAPRSSVTSSAHSAAISPPPSKSLRLSGAVRRSNRHVPASIEQAPAVDSDEVILCYPQGAPGAVNITNADFKRLQPGEFLNDTLIEFGLKVWLRKLEETNSELAKQIHVFSSFFYKKLNKRNIEEGYESVRKWTSKVDLFSKKYIIVPINEHLHWYLVIIYQPEHILIPPLVVESPVTRRQTLLSSAAEPALEPLKLTPAVTEPHSPTLPEAATSRQRSLSDEVVERNLLDFDAACSITILKDSPKHTGAEVDDMIDLAHSPLTDIDMDVDDDHPLHTVPRDISPTVSNFGTGDASRPPSVHNVDMEDGLSSQEGQLAVERLFEESDADINYASSSAIAPVNFYGKPSAKAQGKRRADRQPKSSMPAQDEDSVPLPDAIPTTYIFTLDSLGSKHPQAIKQLTRYLKMEAKDKRNISESSDPQGKSASVPVQPNYCDCGLYLLHFAQTFVTDPEKYCHIIKTRKKSASMAVKQEDWDNAKVQNMREDMANEIVKLSAQWKKDRAAKEEAKKKEVEGSIGEVDLGESSDDEVNIVETTTTPAQISGKGKGKGKGGNTPKKGKNKPDQ